MMGAGVCIGRGLVALGLRRAQHVLVYVLGGARSRSPSSLHTYHHLLVILCQLGWVLPLLLKVALTQVLS